MWWNRLTMPQIQERLAHTRTVIIPFGSVEEHGPHLPLATDLLHAEEVARRTAALHPCFIAPSVAYGICRSTRDHPGTISISGPTLRQLTLDLGREFHRQGSRQLVLLTGHAGSQQVAALTEAGEQLLEELPDLRLAVVNILTLLQEVLKTHPNLVKTPNDGHAGEIETAIMLAAFPELVQGTAPAEWPEFPKFILCRKKRRFWPGGVWGNPTVARPEQGETILQLEAERLAALIRELEVQDY